jgi:hypothetical protein
VTLKVKAFVEVNVAKDVPPFPTCDLAHPWVVKPFEVEEPP